MESEVRLSQDWPLGRTQYINSFSLLTNIWAEGKSSERGAKLTALVPSSVLPEVKSIWAQANCQPAVGKNTL